ncbi:MAG: hypothetical protein ACRCSN_09140 [Dermatophilaceae bacterium]
MAPGMVLAVLGAILAVAVRADPPGVNLRALGVILFLAGAFLVWAELYGPGRPKSSPPPPADPFRRRIDETPIVQRRVVRGRLRDRDVE